MMQICAGLHRMSETIQYYMLDKLHAFDSQHDYAASLNSLVIDVFAVAVSPSAQVTCIRRSCIIESKSDEPRSSD